MRFLLNTVRIMVVLAALFAGTFSVQSASAAISICRADPIVWFTDGTKIQMSVTAQTDAIGVLNILYVVHTPLGKMVKQIVYTGGALAGKETVVVVPDKRATNYSTETTVTTFTRNVPVTAYTAYNGFGKGQLNGVSGQRLAISFIAK